MSVNEAAGAFLGLMEPKEAEQATHETPEPQEQVEASEPEELETQEVETEPEPQRFRVKAAGEEREVTFDELVDGYQKGLDLLVDEVVLDAEHLGKSVDLFGEPSDFVQCFNDGGVEVVDFVGLGVTHGGSPGSSQGCGRPQCDHPSEAQTDESTSPPPSLVRPSYGAR